MFMFDEILHSTDPVNVYHQSGRKADMEQCFVDYDREERFKIVNQSFQEHSLSFQNSVSVMNQNLNAAVETKEPLAFSSVTSFIIGSLCLILMVICNSLISPLVLCLKADYVLTKVAWRTQGTALLSLLLSMLSWCISKNGTNPIQDIWKNRSNFFKTGISMCVWNTTFILGGSMTVTSHASILYSSSSVFMMLYFLVTGQPLPSACKIALMMYIGGGYLMISDPHATKVGSDESSMVGDLICFSGAAVGALCCIYFSRIPADIPTFTKNSAVFLFSAIGQMFLFPFFMGFGNFYSFRQGIGAFAWIADADTLSLVLVVSLITGVLGNIGYINSFIYFPAVIVAGFMLLEPFFGQIGGIALGQDNLPGMNTLIGGSIIIIGFALSGYGEHRKANQGLLDKTNDRDEICLSILDNSCIN